MILKSEMLTELKKAETQIETNLAVLKKAVDKWGYDFRELINDYEGIEKLESERNVLWWLKHVVEHGLAETIDCYTSAINDIYGGD
jgi:hypothetical protein